MRLLTRYVLREICQVFLVTLLSLTLLMVLVGAVKEAINQGLGLAQIVQLLPYLLPNALMFAVPGTILFAVSSVYGRMSATNELIALKSLGLSPMIVIWPALMLATLLSFSTVWLNDLAVSWGFHGVQRVVIDALEDIAYGMLRTHKSFNSATFSVTVRAVEGKKLIAPNFSLPSGDDSGPVSLWAKYAYLHSTPGSGKLTIELYDSTIDSPTLHANHPGRFEREIEVGPGGGKVDKSPAHLALYEIPAALARQREEIEQVEERMVALAGFQSFTGDFDALWGGSWKGDSESLRRSSFELYRLQTEPPRRWAAGFSCLCFALVGTAMAIRMKNSDALRSFALVFFPILVVYYPLLAFGVDRAKAGAITPYAVWMGNAMLVLWGTWLLRRVIRY